MIPLHLLRVKISNKGKSIAPVFCTSDEDVSLAANIIGEFEESWKKRDSKGLLTDRIGLIEGEHGDYKLVRGISTLLERRCTFVNSSEQSRNNGIDSVDLTIEPDVIRRSLFEESSKSDLALTILRREEIIQSVARQLGVDKENVLNQMWSDLDENLVVENFDRITPAILVAWYNLALIQTLLFSCTTLQVALHGGSSWKRVLRDVKRVGLMYNIRNQPSTLVDRTAKNTIYHDDTVVCSLDGPQSMFKMTEIYGTAIAKLLPSIISAESWSLQAWIIRKSISVGRKMYEFHISKENAPHLMALPDHNNSKKITAKSGSSFDSTVEEKFAIKFQQFRTGWTLIREPDPIILDNDKAFIPDFMFERYGCRIYLEIVGFWTTEYIERKIGKLTRISSANKELSRDDKLDIFIEVNNDYYTTSKYKKVEKDLISRLGSLVQKDHLILYKNGQVPLRAILSYLKSIDQEMIRRIASTAPNDLLAEIDRLTIGITQDTNEDDSKTDGGSCSGIVSIGELAEKYDIPSDSVLIALRSREAGNVNVNDYRRSYLIVGTYLISRSKILELEKSLNSISSFMDAIFLFKKYKVPESCHVDLLSKLGYDIIWRDIDSTNASIERRKR
jgi:predicted nuclease of restriction endonuclease-like RecB superfamily